MEKVGETRAIERYAGVHIYAYTYTHTHIYTRIFLEAQALKNSILREYGKITDLPIKPTVDLMRKGKKIRMISIKLSEQDAALLKEYAQLEFLFLLGVD